MAATARGPEAVYQTALVNYLVSMARTVEGSVNRALEALFQLDERLASGVFLTEPRINEMEILIDEQAIRQLRTGKLPDEDVRLIVATLKINNDLERIGDLAVNIGQRVLSLAPMKGVAVPLGLEQMAVAVRAMLAKSLGALIYRNVELANDVLASDDEVDRYRDVLFENLLKGMQDDLNRVTPNLHFILATRYLERIADHATNIAEDIVFWVRGLDVRHSRARSASEERATRDPEL